MSTVQHHPARTVAGKHSAGSNYIRILLDDASTFALRPKCDTTYGLELIQQIRDHKGPAWLRDEIARPRARLGAANAGAGTHGLRRGRAIRRCEDA